MKQILLLFILFINILGYFAQHVEFKAENFPNDKPGFKKAVANLERGDKYFEEGSVKYEKALEYYLKAHEFNPNHARLNYQIGIIYNAMNLKEQAAEFLEKAIALDPSYKESSLFVLAEAYHLSGNFNKAIEKYQEVINMAQAALEKAKKKKDKQDYQDDISLSELRIRQCKNAIELSKDTLPVMYENLGKKINSKYPDYSAVVNADETLLVFTSRRQGSTGGNTPPGDVYQYEDIYFSQKAKNGEWTAAKKIKGKVNTPDHEAPVWLSADGKRMFIYRYKGNGDIFETTFDGKEWSTPKKLSPVNTKYRETHASMTSDGKTIYFTSNHEKLSINGSMDIFKVDYNPQTKKWSKPQNLGPVINSPYDEDCVFISIDGNTLYFSSQGHNSMGGFDFFKSQKVNGEWTKPVNFGYPINTPANDIFIFFTADGKHAYFDSDRKDGVGEKDIYKLTLLDDLKIPITVLVKDAKTKELISSILEVRSSIQHEPILMHESSQGTYTGEVQYAKQFTITASSSQYKPYTSSFSSKVADPLKDQILLEIFLEPIPKEDVAVKEEEFTYTNIYFDYHVYELREESIKELQKVRDYLVKNPKFKVYLEGHTDHVSSDGFNITLSRNRVNAAANWLIKHGISANRITKKWYGKSKPAVPNTNPDGTDNPDNRQKNRRVEIKIVR
ncbi:MAG: OmpA family protein [Flavobacteriales bacterium]|nr:OmpA family protein [Flavobacteriales bacterium]